jgi:hypothetical protein
MQLLVITVLGVAAAFVAYAFGVPGPVDALIFLAFITAGATLRVFQPIIDWLTRP